MLIKRAAPVAVLLAIVALGVYWYHQKRSQTPSVSTHQSNSVLWTSRDAKDERHDTAIVFIHGILGDLRATFTSASGVFWPDLLKSDPLFKRADIYTYGYRSELFAKGLTIDQLAQELHLVLTSSGLLGSHQRVIFVCHNMGGLVARSYLTACSGRNPR